MAKCTGAIGFLFYLVIGFVWALDADRIYFNEEDIRRWNTPPELIVDGGRHKTNANNDDTPHARFIPFSASFTLNSGDNNAHSLNVGGDNKGITLSQSQSSSSNVFGDAQSGTSASQSSSFSAGLSGISASDANAFNLNHPLFGSTSKTSSNSFSTGQAAASAHGNVVNNQAITGAQSSIGTPDYNSFLSSGATSSAGNHQSVSGEEANISASRGQGHRNGRPPWTNIRPNNGIQNSYTPSRKPQINQRPLHSWDRNSQNSPTSLWSQNGREDVSLQISAASATSASSSTSSHGFASGQSTSQSNWGPNGPMSWTNNQVQTSGNAQSNAQGAAAAVGQHSDGKTQASFSSGAISGSSIGNGHSQGTSMSNNRGENSRGDVTSEAVGISSVQGSANAGSVSFVRFPEDRNDQNIPAEFVRSGGSDGKKNHQNRRMRQRNPIDRFFTDITDTVVDLFDI